MAFATVRSSLLVHRSSRTLNFADSPQNLMFDKNGKSILNLNTNYKPTKTTIYEKETISGT